ncbi:MAG: type II secretion system F family protein [Sideroxyarcus sp.]|nr:type II secretion system F family protein [Sideroxyarcus sp.]
MQYELKVLRGNEGLLAITLDAADAADAEAHARAQGYTVVAATAMRHWRAWQPWRQSGFPLAMFSQELVALLEAGLSLIEALEALAEKEAQAEVRKTLTQIIAALYEGRSFSYALEQLPGDFPALYVATVRASEKTGSLAEVLSRYIVYQTQMDGIRRKVITYSIYPVILLVVGGLVMLFLMAFVVPRFSHIYADMGGDLPFMSRMLMHWGQLLEAHGRLFAVGTAALCGGLLFAASRPAFRQQLARKLWQMPALGKRMQVYQMARFYRSLGMLLQGGMPILAALQLVGGLLQESMREQLALAATGIREGCSISQAMDKHGLVTPLALRLLRVGERTGQMGSMMERIAAFYEEETARWVERFVKLLEPLLMTAVGLVIGIVVVLMYFPIFELAGSIQ